MQVKELLEIIDIEQKRLNKQIEQDKRNVKNRNNVSVKKFYNQQISINEDRYNALEHTIQIILMHVSVEDQPD